MAKKIYGPVNGARKEVTAIYGPINGARKEVLKVYGSVNGARKLVWEKAQPNLYGILTYYGVTLAPAGTVADKSGTTPALTGTLSQPLSDFTSAVQTELYNEGYMEQINPSMPIKITIFGAGMTMSPGDQLDPYNFIIVEVADMSGTYLSLRNWSSYSDISSYVDFRAAESGVYDGEYNFEVLTEPGEIVDKTTQASFALTSLSMYETGYSASGFNIGTETISPERIKSFVFGDLVTSVPNEFLANSALETISFGNSNITTIGNYFLEYCNNFAPTGTLDLSSVTSIGTNFLFFCKSFNSPITFNANLTSLPSHFLNSCVSFNQPLTIPVGVHAIPSYFLDSCTNFNSSITLSQGGYIDSIGSDFLAYCGNFNQPLSWLSDVDTIGSSFLNECISFNQTVTLNSATSIGNYFMQYCYSFNQPISLSASVYDIGNNFMRSCTAFNQPFTIPYGVYQIGTNFLAYCDSLNSPITMNCPYLASVGTNFMRALVAFTSYVNVTASVRAPRDTYSFSAYSNSVPAYTTGVQICGSWEGQVSSRTSSPYRKIVACGL